MRFSRSCAAGLNLAPPPAETGASSASVSSCFSRSAIVALIALDVRVLGLERQEHLSLQGPRGARR